MLRAKCGPWAGPTVRDELLRRPELNPQAMRNQEDPQQRIHMNGNILERRILIARWKTGARESLHEEVKALAVKMKQRSFGERLGRYKESSWLLK